MLDKIEIIEFILEWFSLINNHESIEKLIDMLDTNGFELRFPEKTITGKEELEDWYNSVIHKYFDQVHNVKNVDIELSKGKADIILTLNWEARFWEAPNPYSNYLKCEVIQSWVLVKDPVKNKPKIKKYIVNYLKDLKGSV